jgi:hypothetical protein
LAAAHSDNLFWRGEDRDMRKKEERKETKKKRKSQKKNLRKGWTKVAGHGDDETPRIRVVL